MHHLHRLHPGTKMFTLLMCPFWETYVQAQQEPWDSDNAQAQVKTLERCPSKRCQTLRWCTHCGRILADEVVCSVCNGAACFVDDQALPPSHRNQQPAHMHMTSAPSQPHTAWDRTHCTLSMKHRGPLASMQKALDDIQHRTPSNRVPGRNGHPTIRLGSRC